MISWSSVTRRERRARTARAAAALMVLSTPNDRLSPVVSDSDDIVGSQGVVTKNFGGLVLGEAEETGTPVTNPLFNDARQVTNRNTPMMINGVFLNRIFWDGRGSNLFN